jgi:hypothetical protein
VLNNDSNDDEEESDGSDTLRDDVLIVLPLTQLAALFDHAFLVRIYAESAVVDVVDGEFAASDGTAGGSPQNASWQTNRRYLVRAPPGAAVDEACIVLSQPDTRRWHVDGRVKPPPPPPTSAPRGATPLGLPALSFGMHVLRCDVDGRVPDEPDVTLGRSPYSRVRDVAVTLRSVPPQFVCVPAATTPGVEGRYRLTLYSPSAAALRISFLPSSSQPVTLFVPVVASTHIFFFLKKKQSRGKVLVENGKRALPVARPQMPHGATIHNIGLL